jgi:CspA family cold shock protein
MTSGIVTWFSSSRGYGFIEQEEGWVAFVHRSDIAEDGRKTLAEGDRVTFDVVQKPFGPTAANVIKV